MLPHHFRLYFRPNSDQLTPESLVEYRDALADIAHRGVYEIEVIGYTDTFGTSADDRQLRLPGRRRSAACWRATGSMRAGSRLPGAVSSTR